MQNVHMYFKCHDIALVAYNVYRLYENKQRKMYTCILNAMYF